MKMILKQLINHNSEVVNKPISAQFIEVLARAEEESNLSAEDVDVNLLLESTSGKTESEMVFTFRKGQPVQVMMQHTIHNKHLIFQSVE
jgi:hypothetical protein